MNEAERFQTRFPLYKFNPLLSGGHKSTYIIKQISAIGLFKYAWYFIATKYRGISYRIYIWDKVFKIGAIKI